jgi:hypothetical protein
MLTVIVSLFTTVLLEVLAVPLFTLKIAPSVVVMVAVTEVFIPVIVTVSEYILNISAPVTSVKENASGVESTGCSCCNCHSIRY